jgi:hypothetical protein
MGTRDGVARSGHLPRVRLLLTTFVLVLAATVVMPARPQPDSRSCHLAGRFAGMRDAFLRGAEAVLAALSDARVAQAWGEPSVLADQTVGSLASHIARGGVWVVGDYLDAPLPHAEVDIPTAARYFSQISEGLTADDHAAIRARGATIAADGPDAVITKLTAALPELRARLAAEPPDRSVAVYAGLVMPLDEYLLTRIVEQAVHLDDLARSLDVPRWAYPEDVDALVVACGAEIGRLRHGGAAMVRALYRGEAEGVLPVL